MVWAQVWGNTAEGGTNNVAITPANSGGTSGDPISRANATDIGTAAGNSFVFSNAWASSGVMSFLQRQATGSASRNQAFVTWATAQGDFGFRVAYRMNSLPLLTSPVVVLYSDAAYATGRALDKAAER